MSPDLARRIATLAESQRGAAEALARRVAAIDDPRRLPHETRRCADEYDLDARRLLGSIADALETPPLQTTGPALALALRVGVASAEAREERLAAPDVAWTCPDLPRPPARRTQQALLDVVNAAQQRLVLVSYATYWPQEVVDAILRAHKRGVVVQIFLERSKEDGGTNVFATHREARKYFPFAELYALKEGFKGALHAKCAVADEETAFVPSANLTQNALSANIELGIVARRGNVAKEIVAKIDALLHARICERVDQK